MAGLLRKELSLIWNIINGDEKNSPLKYHASKTKIIATIGPASAPEDVLRKMLINGVDVCRLNFSHGMHDSHVEAVKTIRELNKELGINVAILADLQGPKIRIGDTENNSVELINGGEFTITTNKCIGNTGQSAIP